MKTISQISAANVADDGVIHPAAKFPQIKGKTAPFNRQMRPVANGIYFESSLGAKVFISRADLYSLVETHEPLFKEQIPVAQKAG
jgi:hypothetical protein